MKKFVCASLSATLCLTTAAPAFAQSLSKDFGFYDAYASRQDAASAVLDYRIPFGGREAGKANYGLSLKYGPSGRGFDAREGWKPDVKLADFRLGDEGLKRAQVGGLTFAGSERTVPGDGLNAMEGKDSTTWIIIGLVVAGAVVWAVSENDDDDDDD